MRSLGIGIAIISLLLVMFAIFGLWRTLDMAETLRVVPPVQPDSFDANN